MFEASFETFGSGSFGGPLGVRWVLVAKSQNLKTPKNTKSQNFKTPKNAT